MRTKMKIFKISVSNVSSDVKPSGSFYKDLSFNVSDVTIEEFVELVSNGYTFKYIPKDSSFSQNGYKFKENYVGTQVIFVDVDHSSEKPSVIYNRIEFKPTMYYTTFSNLKDGKYSFRFVYVFNDVINGSEEFSNVLSVITNDYSDLIDKNAKDCFRMFFGSNKENDGFELYNSRIIYDISNIKNNALYCATGMLNTRYNERCSKRYFTYAKGAVLNNFDLIKENDEEEGKCEVSQNLNYYNINKNTIIYDITEIQKMGQLSDDMLKSMNMPIEDFVKKFQKKYSYYTRTYVNFENDELYKNVEGKYYVIDGANRYKINKELNIVEIKRVKRGERDKQLFYDILNAIEILKPESIDHLFYVTKRLVNDYYDNSDNEINNRFILRKIYQALNTDVKIKPTTKKYKMNMAVGKEIFGYDKSVQSVVGSIKKEITNDKIYDVLIDYIDTVDNVVFEEAYDIVHECGLKTTKKRLEEWFKSKNINYLYKENLVIDRVIELSMENKSIREIEKSMKMENFDKISKSKIQRILKEHDEEIKKLKEKVKSQDDEIENLKNDVRNLVKEIEEIKSVAMVSKFI